MPKRYGEYLMLGNHFSSKLHFIFYLARLVGPQMFSFIAHQADASNRH